MAIGDLKDILHKIKAKLYPSYLPGTEGKYIARTDNEATLSIEEVCTTLKNRGGFQGKFDELVDNVHQFFDELAYQVLDGYAVSTGYFSIHPNIGGTFTSDKEAHDHKKHPITFRFRTLAKLRALTEKIAVEIEGIADINGYIMEFIDVYTGAVNETFTQMNEFIITGHRLKVVGDDPSIGVFFKNTATGAMTKAHSLAENSSHKLIGIFPGINDAVFQIVIKTQFSGSSKPLKEVRTIESNFTIKRP